jgi:serine/threonine protein kinase
MVNHTSHNPAINPQDIKANGFLLSNEEKEHVLFHMAFHWGKNEKIPNESPLNKNNHGAVLINRSKQTIYKIYHPETIEEKHSRKESARNFGINLKSKGVIGQGAYGKVRICQDLINGNFYAVKIIKKSLVEQLGCFIGFNELYQPNEIKFLKQEHFFIDCIETSDKFYIIEELVAGEDLSKLSWHAKPDDENIQNFFDILIKIIKAVDSFHDQGCIHRDIKPNNFLYDKKENKIYLIDFGLAIRLPKGYRSIYTEDIVGTDRFIAPEITEDSKYGYVSDIYALGHTIKCITDEFSDELSTNYKFVNQLYGLVSEMMDENKSCRPSLSSINKQIKFIKKQAIDEQKSIEINGTPFLCQANFRRARFFTKTINEQKIIENTNRTNLGQIGLFAVKVKENQVVSDTSKALLQEIKNEVGLRPDFLLIHSPSAKNK